MKSTLQQMQEVNGLPFEGLSGLQVWHLITGSHLCLSLTATSNADGGCLNRRPWLLSRM